VLIKLLITITLFETVARLKCLGTAVRDSLYIFKEIKATLNST